MKKFRMTNVATGVSAAIVVALLSACSGGGSQAGAQHAAGQSPLDALIADAKAEGTVTVYSVLDDRIVQLLQSAFEKKYGINMSFVRDTAATLEQRFSAEKDAKAPVADVVLDLPDGFIEDGEKDGSFKKLENSDIPGYPNSLPKGALVDGAAIVQVADLALGWNTDTAQKLTSWKDLLDPSLKGKVAIADPTSGVYNALFYELEQQYGSGFLTALGGQVGRVYSSGSQIIEALASGEAGAVAGTLAPAVEIDKSQGAPVEAGVPNPTLKAPTLMAINAQAPHSAAARLLAYYLTTQDGLKVLNDEPGMEAPTDKVLTTGWVYSPALQKTAAAHLDEIKQALGAS